MYYSLAHPTPTTVCTALSPPLLTRSLLYVCWTTSFVVPLRRRQSLFINDIQQHTKSKPKGSRLMMWKPLLQLQQHQGPSSTTHSKARAWHATYCISNKKYYLSALPFRFWKLYSTANVLIRGVYDINYYYHCPPSVIIRHFSSFFRHFSICLLLRPLGVCILQPSTIHRSTAWSIVPYSTYVRVRACLEVPRGRDDQSNRKS